MRAGAAEDEATRSPDHLPVSIIVPCYNYGRFLDEALESALAQTYPADEIVVLDDGSTDTTPEVIARYTHYPTVRAIRQDNQGAIATFNRGIRESRGTFFVVLSADDRLDPRFLERTVPALQAHPRAGYVYTGYRVFGARHRVRPALPFSRARLARRPYFTASALMRRAAFDDAGGYSPEMRIGYEDWDLYLTMAERGWEGVALPEALFHYRQHRVASRNTMSFRTWLELLTMLYRRHRSLHRLPLGAFLARAILDQNWLTLRAAPRAALRRLGTPPPAQARPRACFLTAELGAAGLPRHAPPDASVTVLAVSAEPAGAPGASAGARRLPPHGRRVSGRALSCSARGSAAGAAGSAARLATRAVYQHAVLYHAQGLEALAAGTLAACCNRAVLLYEVRPSCATYSWLEGVIERLLLLRVDALIVAGEDAAAGYIQHFNMQPTIRYAREEPIAMIERQVNQIDSDRLAQLCRDILAIYAVEGERPEC